MGQQCSTLPPLSNLFCSDTPPIESCGSLSSTNNKQRRNDANIAATYREEILDGRAPANIAATPRRTLTDTSESTNGSTKLVERDTERRSPCPPIKEGSCASSIDSSHESLNVNDHREAVFETQGCYRLNLGASNAHSAHQILRHSSSDSSDCYSPRDNNTGSMDIFRSTGAEEPAISPPRILRNVHKSNSSEGQFAQQQFTRNANAEISTYSDANAMQTLYIHGEYDDVEHLVCDGAKKLHYYEQVKQDAHRKRMKKKAAAERRKRQHIREQELRNRPTQHKPLCSKQQSSINTNACCTGDTGLLEGYMGVIGSFLCDRAGPNECFQPQPEEEGAALKITTVVE